VNKSGNYNGLGTRTTSKGIPRTHIHVGPREMATGPSLDRHMPGNPNSNCA
jgi:hypothetical protein